MQAGFGLDGSLGVRSEMVLRWRHLPGRCRLVGEVSMRRLVLAPALAGLLVLPLPVAADEITEQLDLAKELYEEGDLDAAVTELQYAIGEIQAKLGDAFAETFPPPPAGWSAGEATREAGAAFMGGGTMVNREYTQDAGNGRMNAQLIIDNPMIQGMAALFSNPAMLSANSNMTRIRMGRDNAILDFDDGTRRGEITFMIGGGRAMLKVEGNDLASGDDLVELLKAWDMDGLKAVAGL
jgi:hypothetical protein